MFNLKIVAISMVSFFRVGRTIVRHTLCNPNSFPFELDLSKVLSEKMVRQF
jgi:hypothetical protein